MTRKLRLPALAGAMSAAFCLATLAPTASNEAVAQGIRVYVAQPQYNGYGAGYSSGYGNRYGSNLYGGYGSGTYGNRYSSNPYGSYGNSTYGYSTYGYSTYGNGNYGNSGYSFRTDTYTGVGQSPYGYGTSVPYGSTSTGYQGAVTPTPRCRIAFPESAPLALTDLQSFTK